MGSYTTGTYKFYKPASNDYVDPELDVANNLDIIDSTIFNFLNWSNPALSPLPVAGNVVGKKAIDPKTNIVYVWNGTAWVPINIINCGETWTNLTMVDSTYFSGSGSDLNGRAAWRYTNSDHNHVELKGKIFRTTAIPNNTSISLCATGSIPNPVPSGSGRYFNLPPGIGSSNINNNNGARIAVNSDGSISAYHYGTSNAGDINNYFSLDSIKYPTA